MGPNNLFRNIKTPSNKESIWYFFNTIPPITRFILTSIISTTILVKLKILPISYLIFSSHLIFSRFQIWRCFTSFIIIPSESISVLMEIYNIYRCSSYLELSHFNSTYHGFNLDYAFYLGFNMLFVLSMTSLLQLQVPSLTSGFIGFITYTWCSDNPNDNIQIYGLFPIPSKYFPIFELGIAFLFGSQQNFLVTLLGYMIGYIYVCLDSKSFGALGNYFFKNNSDSRIKRSGYFRSPKWLMNAYDTFLLNGNLNSKYRGSVSFKGQGTRLGNQISSSVNFQDFNIRERKGTHLSNPSETSSLPVVSTWNSLFSQRDFRGRGRRVGTKMT